MAIENNNYFSSEMQNIVTVSSQIYSQIKNQTLVMIDGRNYSNQDKKCLSLLLGVLKSNTSAGRFLNDFDINYESICQAFPLDLSAEATDEFLEEIADLVILMSDEDSRYYTRDLSPMILVGKLLMTLECGSSFFSDISNKLNLETSTDLLDSKLGAMIDRKLEKEEKEHFENLNEQNIPLAPPNVNNNVKRSNKNSGVLTLMTANPYNIDLSLGRDAEIRRLMVSLLMPNKSVLLIGESGVGKTSIVEGLVHRIARGQVPDAFLDKKIYSLSVAALVSGSRYVGMFEEKLMNIVNDIIDDPEVILFIDELHAIVGAGKGDKSANDMANILKPYLDKGQLKVIGTTTTEEYEKYIKPDTALKRRFEIINVHEPKNEVLQAICSNVINKLSLEMNMFFLEDTYIQDEVITALIELTDAKHRHYRDKANNPDLLVSIITRSFALAKYYDKQVVEISDLIEAIEDNERIYSGSKTKIINMLNKMVSYPSVTTTNNGARIIKFPGVNKL